MIGKFTMWVKVASMAHVLEWWSFH